MFIFINLHQLNSQHNDLITEIQQKLPTKKSINDYLGKIESELNDLTKSTDRTIEKTILSKVKPSLVDEYNTIVSTLTLVEQSNQTYRATTLKGYHFLIDSEKNILSNSGEHFYLSENCEGDVFTKSSAASLLKDQYHNIWYVDKKADDFLLNIHSKKDTSGQCLALAGDAISVRQLLKNNSFETGLNDIQTTMIKFN